MEGLYEVIRMRVKLGTKLCILCRIKEATNWTGHVHSKGELIRAGFCDDCIKEHEIGHRAKGCSHSVQGMGCYGRFYVGMGSREI